MELLIGIIESLFDIALLSVGVISRLQKPQDRVIGIIGNRAFDTPAKQTRLGLRLLRAFNAVTSLGLRSNSELSENEFTRITLKS